MRKKSESLKLKLVEQIENDLYDREALPHMAMIPEWYDRYMTMITLLHKYFQEVDKESPSLICTGEDFF